MTTIIITGSSSSGSTGSRMSVFNKTSTSATSKDASRWGFSDDILPNARVFDISVSCGGEVVSSPIEEGSFTSYNKTIEPMEVEATLAFSGTDNFLQSVLDQLKKLQESVTVFSIKTPTYEYKNMTMQNYDYGMRREDGSGVLYAKCTFIEIREVKIAYTTGSPITQTSTGDASATSTVDNGVAQPVSYDSSGSGSDGSSAAEYSAGEATKNSSTLHDLGSAIMGK